METLVGKIKKIASELGKSESRLQDPAILGREFAQALDWTRSPASVQPVQLQFSSMTAFKGLFA